MKIALLHEFSANNAHLAQLTERNRTDYCNRHSYDYYTVYREYRDYSGSFYEIWKKFRDYDFLFKIGSDVVITDPASPLPLPTHGAVMMSRQPDGMLNNDVAVWRSSHEASFLLTQLSNRVRDWAEMPYLWQSCISETPGLRALVDEQSPRVLNATDLPGEWAWEPGDFVCHCLGGTLAEKISRCAAVLKKLDTG